MLSLETIASQLSTNPALLLRENRWLEFKLLLPKSKCRKGCTSRRGESCDDDLCIELGKVECASDVSQFANADGGYLVFGVVEKAGGVNVVGLSDPEDVQRRVENIIKERCVPEPVFTAHHLHPTVSERACALLVIFVRPSVQPVWVKGAFDCVKIVRRHDASKSILDPIRTTMFISDPSRQRRLEFKRVVDELQALTGDSSAVDVELGSPVVRHQEDLYADNESLGNGLDPVPPRVPIKTVVKCASADAEDFTLLFQRPLPFAIKEAIRVPYSMIAHVWRTRDDRLGLMLDAEIRIVRADDGSYRIILRR